MSQQSDCQSDFLKPIRRNLFIAVVITATLFIITGCEPPPPPDLESPGAKMYIEKCSTCHPPRHPKILNYKRWVRMVDNMEKKVVTSGVREPLTDEERKIILEYLKEHSAKMR